MKTLRIDIEFHFAHFEDFHYIGSNKFLRRKSRQEIFNVQTDLASIMCMIICHPSRNVSYHMALSLVNLFHAKLPLNC
jgi:hypothetical protein